MGKRGKRGAGPRLATQKTRQMEIQPKWRPLERLGVIVAGDGVCMKVKHLLSTYRVPYTDEQSDINSSCQVSMHDLVQSTCTVTLNGIMEWAAPGVEPTISGEFK
jgi:hypothetical protein